MKLKVFLVSITVAIFLVPSFALAGVSTSDLNKNGINDSEEEEVRVESYATLLSGEYDFKNLVITNGAVLLLQGDPDSANVFKGVKINAQNITVEAGSSISADSTGYGAYTGPGTPPENLYYAGASYGGRGDRNIADTRYGSATHPTDLGTGGSSRGGGAMWFVVSGFTNNGSLSANGLWSASGGSIYIVAQTLSGSGKFSANGGWISSLTYSKGMGGGGRIALYYKSSTFIGTVEAKGGCGSYDGWSRQCAENGTVGFFDTTHNDFLSGPSWRFQAGDGPFVFNNVVIDSGQVILENNADLTADSLHMDHSSSFTIEGGEMHVAHIGLDGRSVMTLGGNTLKATTLALVGGSTLTTAREKKISLEIGDVQISADSVISAEGTGYPKNTGLGAPRTEYAGASYGGVGSGNPPDSVYGSAEEPTDLGSGGGSYFGHGGGAIRIITNYLSNNGIISANGTITASGGSVWITAKELSGSGKFSANGGGSDCPNTCFGPGGGGRVAIYYNTGSFGGTAEAKGVNMYGGRSEAGTVIVKQTDAVCATCFSNVLFIPGLEASRLYQTRTDGSEDQLWEPNNNKDVEDLYLNSDGSSKNEGIYTRDIVKETNIPIPLGPLGQNIYKSFAERMDGLVNDNKIAEWRAFPYDWRQSFEDVVTLPQKIDKNGQEIALLAVVKSLVESSKNGKVSIIAHSNGGLVAKALLKKLEEEKLAGESDTLDHIDTLILVASPQLGTPSAVAGILHGYDQEILGNLLMDTQHARELGRNMPGAFGLLPSKMYINNVSASPATFVDNPVASGVTTNLVQNYGPALDTYSEYKNFLFGNDGRSNPLPAETTLPIRLSESLFTRAENLHNALDTWSPPANVRVIQIAGWGLDTLASFEYYPKLSCAGSSQGVPCSYVLDERPRFTADGDKTVVVPSALSMEGEKWWVNIPLNNVGLRKNREHKDILEINSILDFVSKTLEKEPVEGLTYFSTTTPIDTTNRFRLSVHSPVTIDAYDLNGNHTGKVCPPDSDFCYTEENISNSSYLEFGEGKYLNVPEEGMKTIKLAGTDIGTFTYESEKVLPNGTSATLAFKDIPVTSETSAEITMDNNGKPEMKLDVTGDGKTDFTVQSGTAFDPVLYLQIMRKTIEGSDIPNGRKNNFFQRIDNTIKAIQKGKINKAKLKVDNFISILKKKVNAKEPKHPRPHRLDKTEAEQLLNMLDILLNNLN